MKGVDIIPTGSFQIVFVTLSLSKTNQPKSRDRIRACYFNKIVINFNFTIYKYNACICFRRISLPLITTSFVNLIINTARNCSRTLIIKKKMQLKSETVNSIAIFSLILIFFFYKFCNRMKKT